MRSEPISAQAFAIRLFFALFPVLLLSCDRTAGSEEFVGPLNTATPVGFAVSGDTLYPSRNLVSFSGEALFFRASFNATVEWTLEITGLESGAQRILSGTSRGLDSSNSRFGGGSENVFFFRKGETCQARLLFPGWARVYQTRFRINTLPVYPLFLTDDFETPDDSDGFAEIFQDDGDAGLLLERGTTADRVEGDRCLHMKGQDANGNYWTTVLGAGLLPQPAFSGLAAGQVFWNGYVRAKEGSILEIQILEDENGDGQFSAAQDEQFRYRLSPGAGPWQLFSAPLSAFEKSAGSGDGILLPSRMLKVSLVLVCSQPQGTAEVWVDYTGFSLLKSFSQP